jgi:hypothetical protein
MNIEVTFYNTESGLIVRKGIISRDMVEANLQPGESWIEGNYSPREFKIKNNQAVPISQSELHIKDVKVQWANVIQDRNMKLFSSDWTQLPDVPLSTKESWAEYRQALRDITLQPDPFNIVWPTPPQ